MISYFWMNTLLFFGKLNMKLIVHVVECNLINQITKLLSKLEVDWEIEINEKALITNISLAENYSFTCFASNFSNFK